MKYEDLVEEKCLHEQLPRPGALVRGPSNLLMEVTRLNAGAETKCGFMTQPGCLERWDMDGIGRPLAESTEKYLARALKVNHPHDGMLSPASPAPPRRCARPVPRILHIIWVGKRVISSRHLAFLVKAALANPKWKMLVWLDRAPAAEELSAFSELRLRPAGAPTFRSVHELASDMRNWDIVLQLNTSKIESTAALSDVLRLELVYLYGGVYMDIDSKVFHGFDDYGSLFWWPWVVHKVCGVNMANSMFGFDRHSGFLNFALDAFRENCMRFDRCEPYDGAGPPFMAISILRYNSSDISMIGNQHFSASQSGAISVLGHYNDNTWR